MAKPLRIAVMWRPGRNIEWQKRFTQSDIPDDSMEEASLHRDALSEAGHDAFLVRWDSSRPATSISELRQRQTDLVFNASSLEEVTSLEAHGIPYCGSGLDLVALDKAGRKKILAFHGIPTAPFVVIDRLPVPGRNIVGIDSIRSSWKPVLPLSYPLFVKPVRGRGSAGVTDDSIVTNNEDLYSAAHAIISRLGQATLVESYVRGREVTVGVFGNPATVMPPLEIEYNRARTNSFDHKKDNEIMHCPARLDPAVMERVKIEALNTFEALGARDFGRIDTMVTDDGTPWVLEINTFAGLQMLTGQEKHLHASYMGMMARRMGMTRSDLLGTIVEAARARYGI